MHVHVLLSCIKGVPVLNLTEYRCSISSPLHVPGTLQLYVPGSLHTAVVYLLVPTAAAGTAVP